LTREPTTVPSFETKCFLQPYVQHRLDNDEAKRCGSGHFVAPTSMTAKAQRRRAIKAHNGRVRAQAIKQQPASEYLTREAN